MDEAHRVDGIEGHDDFGSVELGPLLRHIVITHEVDEVTARHVVHHHVQVAVVLERIVQLTHTNNTSKCTGHGLKENV